MRTRVVLVSLVLGLLSWGHVTCLTAASADQDVADSASAGPRADRSEQGQQAKASGVARDAPVVTVNGLCDTPSGSQIAVSDCKTVITQSQFETLIDAVQPNMPARARREFALRYAEALAMSKVAEEMGLDSGAVYEEQIKIARMQVLSKALKKAVQEKFSRVSDEDVEAYYKNNIERFEEAGLDRIYIPKTQQPHTLADPQLNDANKRNPSLGPEQTMKAEADELRVRAVAGEEFANLQADAYRVAGVKSSTFNTNLKIRRISLPPDQVSIMDLKPREVSPIMADGGGYVIYKVKTKDTLPVDQVREEIKAILRAQQIQEEMNRIQDSVTPTLDEEYFRHNRAQQGISRTDEPTAAVSKLHSGTPE
jgi:PPIC-type PPIASE domain